MRTIYRSKKFEKFYSSLRDRTKEKVDYVIGILRNEKVITSNFVKKIIGSSGFYELRIRTDNEYRVIIIAIDHDSLINSTEILLLNGFMKKSNSDYARQLIIAQHIKENFIDNEYKTDQQN